MLASSMLDLIGKTPLVSLERMVAHLGLQGVLLAKLERNNPGGSVKDRAALYMIRAAEKEGLLKPGGLIVEPTSGNTGIGLAAVAAVCGYRVKLVMPESMSMERRQILAAYGAELVLTPAAQGMAGAVRRAEEIAQEEAAFLPMQFANAANAQAHKETTAKEILQDVGSDFEFFVAGVGTGGTVSGVGALLKKEAPSVRVVAVEPSESPVIHGGPAASHGIQGIGANFVPALYDAAVVDEVMEVSTPQAYEMTRLLPRVEGLLCGISSGAALYAAAELLKRSPGARIVLVLPDTGERYLSTPVFKIDG